MDYYTVFVIAAIFFAATVFAWEIRVYPEFFRPDPSGGLVKADWEGQEPSRLMPDKDGAIHLKAPRNGYTSVHLAVYDETGGGFRVSAPSGLTGVEVDFFREWFHKNGKDGRYYADTLIPIKAGEKLSLPDPDMKIPGQKVSSIWVDIWVSKKAQPGKVPVAIEINTDGGIKSTVRFMVEVLSLAIPDEDAIASDNNTYELGWIWRYFPARAKAASDAGVSFANSDAYFKAVHDTYKMLYEHRSVLHVLGYNHSGGVTAGFAPEITGDGKERHVKSWGLFDRHFGPLLDGSAFKDTRRGPRPIECVYLTINPEWPASYINWGTPLFEAEFVNVVGEMEKHFREKGWTQTDFEMFFNHKKRYKGFEWDGDETRFPKDNVYFKEFGRLLQKAVPEKSPVHFVFRHDASWLMRQQMDELAGVVNFWVCNSHIFSFYPEAPALLKKRGDKVWIYGGSPSHFGTTAAILDMPVDAWMKGIDGYIRWLTTAPGADPWYNSNGGGTAMFFPGDKFGLDEPLPCVRLKLQRNCLQDIALLKLVETQTAPAQLRKAVASLAGGAAPEDWWNDNTAIEKLNPWEWSNATLGDAGKPSVRNTKKLDGRWWLAVRNLAIQQASKVKSAKPMGPARVTTPYRKDLKPYLIQEPDWPELPVGSLTGDVLTQLNKVAETAAAQVNGDDCWNIVTDRSEELMFKVDPRDPWARSDNYDVNFDEFVRTKKLLIRIARMASLPCDCNLWMRSRRKPEVVHTVVRQVNGLSQFYDFGQMAIDPTEEMKKALGGETVTVEGKRENMVSVLAPVKKKSGEVVGFVEVCARKQ